MTPGRLWLSLQKDARIMVDAHRKKGVRPNAAELARRVIAAYEEVRGVELDQYTSALEKEIDEYARAAGTES
jgi:hypothetical protein